LAIINSSKTFNIFILGRIKWRHVIWGVGLQFIFGIIILRWSVGREIFECLGGKVKK